MNSRSLAIGSWVFLSALASCGGDDTGVSDLDGGTDAGDDAGGSGGTGGKGSAGSGGDSAGGGRGGGGAPGGNGGSGGSGGNDPMFSVGGNVEGLNGKGLVLKLNGDEEKSIAKSGSFEFATLLSKGDDYSVMVKTQPSDPTQACAVERATGSVGSADIKDVKVKCSDVVKSVGGTVSGLGGGTVVLENNNADDLSVSADGMFSFATPLKPGADYAVTVATPPAGRSCNVVDGTGKIGDGNVTDVAVECFANLTVAVRPRVGSAELSWNGNGAQSYTAYLSTDPQCSFDAPDTCAGAAKKDNVQTPYVWTGLSNGATYYFAVRGSHTNNFQTRSNVQGGRPHEPRVDGDVTAVVHDGNGTTYIGGAFEHVGVLTGPLVPLDKQTARASRIPSFPILDGGVSSVLADGTGGYFVGGAFLLPGAGSMSYLAHVLADGTVDANWNPAPDGTVQAMALVGTTLYIAGNFSNVDATPRKALAAVSTTGAGAVTAWDPGNGWPDAALGGINALAANATTIYVGGIFTQVGTVERTQLAAIDAAGVVVPGFLPNPNATVTSLQLSGDSLYVGGWFDRIGTGQNMLGHLVRLDPSSGEPNTDFAPRPDAPPTSMSLNGGVLYLGGSFTNFTGGGAGARSGLAAVNASTGALAAWAPEADDSVRAVVSSGDTIYVAGDFTKIGESSRKYLAAIDKQGMLTSWDPRPSAAIDALSVDADTVYASGAGVASYGAEPHARLASFAAGALNTWAPLVADGEVRALGLSGANLLLGGTFTSVGGSSRSGAAAVEAAGTGAVTGWAPALNAVDSVLEVNALAVSGTTVYLGGRFSTSGPINVVAVDASTATIPTAWALSGADGSVDALAVAGSTLYLGGGFGGVGGEARSRLAAVDTTTGAVQSWDPSANNRVTAMATEGTTVFVAGEFTQLGATAKGHLAAVVDGTVDPWDPAVDQPVNSLAVAGGILYVGGQFTQFATLNRGNAAATRTSSPFALLEWTPGIAGAVYAMAADGAGVYIGGSFTRAAGKRCENFCSLLPWAE